MTAMDFPGPPAGKVECDVCGRTIDESYAVPIPAIGYMCPADDDDCRPDWTIRELDT